ncbi:hypothetical protein LDENG_00265490 [Lucifuga dentata]|nr:hypothetical protein LDENG_00265490 [Lucifuga dentata]
MFEPNIFSFICPGTNGFRKWMDGYSVFIHVTLLTIISQRIKPYFSFPDILLNLLIFLNQIFK